MPERPLLEVRGLSVHFPLARRRPFQPKRVLKAVDGIDLDIAPGKTLGLVGESGSGKTTTALAVMQLLAVTGGSIKLEGRELVGLAGQQLRAARRDVQMIFQDPYSSLNPRLRAGAIVEEPLRLSATGDLRDRPDDKARGERVRELFAQVGLSDAQRALFPHQFSGGQRQRIGIARALALQPKLMVCDEPVSALDVAVQAQVLNLLVRLQEKFGLTYLFISHDLAVVEYMCDEVAVMYLGQIVEYASRERLFERPLHPYTWALFSAIPRIEVGDRSATNRVRLEGDPPSPIDTPPGCRFAGRCPFAEQVCRDTPPPLREIEAGHRVACHLVGADGSTPHVSARPPARSHP